MRLHWLLSSARIVFVVAALLLGLGSISFRAAEPVKPDVRLRAEGTPIEIRPGQIGRVRLFLEQGDVKGPVVTKIKALPPGLSANLGLFGFEAGQGLVGDLYISVDEKTPPGEYRLTVQSAPPKGNAAELTINVKVAEPEKAKAVAKEDLRYDGKSFEEWRTNLQTELKPERRAEAIKALGKFGVNGYAREAAVAILQTMRAYDPDHLEDEDRPVDEAAVTALTKVGSDAVPALIDELKNGPSYGRRFAAAYLRWHSKDMRRIPALLAALKDKDDYVRNNALGSLSNEEGYSWKTAELIFALTVLMDEKDDSTRGWHADLFDRVSAKHKEALPLVLKALKDSQPSVRAHAVGAVARIGVERKRLFSILTDAFKETDEAVRLSAAKCLGELGADAKEAVPLLVAALIGKHWTVGPTLYASAGGKPTGSWDEYEQIVQALAAIGTAAKDAVPILSDFAKIYADDKRGEAAKKALEKINKK
jgi:HEAT repeat protein